MHNDPKENHVYKSAIKKSSINAGTIVTIANTCRVSIDNVIALMIEDLSETIANQSIDPKKRADDLIKVLDTPGEIFLREAQKFKQKAEKTTNPEQKIEMEKVEENYIKIARSLGLNKQKYIQTK